MSRAVMQQALEALEKVKTDADKQPPVYPWDIWRMWVDRAITAIKQALAEPEQQPVAWMDIDEHGQRHGLRYYSDGNMDEVPLYTAAPTPRKPEQKLWCACGDSIEPDSGAKCGNCVAGDSAEPEQEMPSDTRYTVAVEGQAPTYWDCIHDAMTNAQRAVYSGVDNTTRAIDDLKAGRIAEWSYGFSAVRIYPPQSKAAPTPRKPLTDEEIALISVECAASAHRHDDLSFARAVIAAYEKKQGETK